MPVAIQANWELIKSLVLQGFTPTQAADKLGVSRDAVRARARRNGWNNIRTQTVQIMTVEGSKAKPDQLSPLNDELHKASFNARKGLATALESSINTLVATRQSKSLKGQSSHVSVIKTLADAAKTVHNWGDNTGSSLLSITSYTDVEQVSQTPTLTNDNGVIDVVSDVVAEPKSILNPQEPDPTK